jgi:dihydropteroate synthase
MEESAASPSLVGPEPRDVPEIPLSPAAARALAAWTGFRAPPGLSPTILGTLGADGVVPGTRPLPLPVEVRPGRRWWWVEDTATVGAWIRDAGRRRVRRWPTPWETAAGVWELGRQSWVMGVLNVTPDSFSDGGAHDRPAEALAFARRLWAAGARLVDVGGESTRPGHVAVDPEVEWARVAPVIAGLSVEERRMTTLDTRHPSIAARAADLGVAALNDVSCLADPEWTAVLAAGSAGLVLMYNRPPAEPRGLDLLDMLQRLAARMVDLEAAGVSPLRVAIDPGLGFAYGMEDNLAMLRSLGVLRVLDRPVVVGPSRKSFLGRVTGRAVDDRDRASAVAGFYALAQGADVIRMHDAAAAVDAAAMADAMVHGGE